MAMACVNALGSRILPLLPASVAGMASAPGAAVGMVWSRGRRTGMVCYVFWIHVFAIHGMVHW